MAQEVKVLLLCDYGDDRHEADSTETFGHDGQLYEIDLCAKHKAQLDKDLSKWSALSRRAGRGISNTSRPVRSRTRAALGAPASGISHATVRAWAIGQGKKVNPKGNLPKALIEEWEKAGRPAA